MGSKLPTACRQPAFFRLIFIHGKVVNEVKAAGGEAVANYDGIDTVEGGKYNIKVNTIAPIAASRMTESLMPPELLEKLKPEFVTPLVAYLCSEECPETGGIYSVGGGYFARIALMEGPGFAKSVDKGISIEDIRDNFQAVNSLENPKYHPNLQSENAAIMANVMK